MSFNGNNDQNLKKNDPLFDLIDDVNENEFNESVNQPKLQLNFHSNQNSSSNHPPTNRSKLVSLSQDDDEDMIDVGSVENPFANTDADEIRQRNNNENSVYYSFEGNPNKSEGASNAGDSNLDLRPADSYYNDFQTIDWVKDLNRDRQRHRELSRKKTWWSVILSLLDSGSGWFCVLLVGLTTGLTAGIVDIGSTWMFDLKLGVCSEGFWLNKEQCCWTPNVTNFDDPDCDEWYSWSKLFIGKSINAPDGYFVNYLVFILWALFLAGLAVRLVVVFAPYACGSGIPEIKTILSGFVIRGYLGKWTLIIKTVGMILAVSAGLTLGKEGPMVHMAVCWGNVFARLFSKYGNNEAKKREIMSASAAAGVAVAFGAPVGGVLFSLEEASYYFPLKTMFRSFFCAMVAANVLRIMNPFGNENLVMFYLDYKAQWHALEILPFALLGVLGGLFGILFNKLNLWWCAKRKSSKFGRYPCSEVLIVTLLTAIISFPQEYLRINSSEFIRILVGICGAGDNITLCDYKINMSNFKSNTLGNYEAGDGVKSAIGMLVLALICKTLFAIFTFGIKVPCGLFIPSLTVGAIMGRIMGVAVEQFVVHNHSQYHWIRSMCRTSSASQPCINPGLYAMVGAAAALGGVTRMTVSLVVIMLELTGGSNYILPLMITTMVSKWTGDRLTRGIYDEHIRLNDYPYLTSNESDCLIKHNTTSSGNHASRTGSGGGDGQYKNLEEAGASDGDEITVLDIMHANGYISDHQPLKILTQTGMTLKDADELLRSSTVNGFPVVVSLESQYLVGFVARRDLEFALRKALDTTGYGIYSMIDFSDNFSSTPAISPGSPKTLLLRNILDLFPITVTDQTPVETVMDFFIKLGLRQVIVTQNGRLRGIITKKDLLRYLNQHNNGGNNPHSAQNNNGVGSRNEHPLQNLASH